MANRIGHVVYRIDRQVPIPIHYKQMIFEEAFRADLVVEDKIIIELKSIEQVSDVHKKQLLTYLRLTGCKLGFLLNFGEALMKRGIRFALKRNRGFLNFAYICAFARCIN